MRTVWPLAVAETLLWATIYYSFPALIPRWLDDFGWSRAEITGAFTLSVLTAAACAPLMGMLIDRGYGRQMMGAGGVLAVLVLVVISRVETSVAFYACWIIMGVAQAACLYEPCFAILTRLFGTDAKRAITAVTLVAGLAGTVSFPAAHFLSEAMGWRNAVLVFAGVVAFSTALAMWALYGSETTQTAEVNQARPEGKGQSWLSIALANPVFWLLATAFACLALNHGAIISHLLLLLDERSVTTGVAVLAASCIGPMQVIGRVGMMVLERSGISTAGVANLSFVFVLFASVALYFSSSATALVFVFVCLQGAGYGVTSIIRPAVTAEFLGRDGFGAISGAMAIPLVGSFALGPTIASFVWGVGGYDTVIVSMFIAALIGFGMFLAACHLNARHKQDAEIKTDR